MGKLYRERPDVYDSVDIQHHCSFYPLTNGNTSITDGKYRHVSAGCEGIAERSYAVHYWANSWCGYMRAPTAIAIAIILLILVGVLLVIGGYYSSM